jgi:predicted dehydrogenase
MPQLWKNKSQGDFQEAEERMPGPLKAAVVGAAGIGKYHAQWYAAEGCEVTAVVGTTPQSAAEAAENLKSLFGIQARGYHSLDEMLEREAPNCVSVCTPPDSHLEPVLKCLQAGVHVMCEKPLHWREDLDANSILSGAKQMADAAQSCGRILAVNTQYTAALEPFFAIYSRERGQLERIESFLFEMESKGSRRGPNEYEDIWRELGPHALSLLLGALPYGKIDMSTLEAEMDRDYVNVRFRWVDGGAAPCDVTILTRCIREGQPKRRFGINGFVVDIGAVREDGVYKTVLRHGESEVRWDDLVRISIRRFIAAVRGEAEPLVSAKDNIRNLEVQLQILQRLPGITPRSSSQQQTG